jgi:hypothetical protein
MTGTKGGQAGRDDGLRRTLLRSGISGDVVDAAWPAWRQDGVPTGASAEAELRFALARRLGLSPKALLEDRVEFVWRDNARFKHLTAEDAEAQAALTSFGMSVARLLVGAVPDWRPLEGLTAADLRKALLADAPFVDLASLVSFCWAVGIPVVHLRMFPLRQKAMHAMVVRWSGRPCVLLGRAASYPAQTAFTLAHELGHAILGHLDGADAVVDLDDPLMSRGGDEEEEEADRFSLEVLTGTAEPEITTSLADYNAPTLAAAAGDAAVASAIEPGTIVLCLGHRTREWAKVMSALRFVYGGPVAVGDYVNAEADGQLQWDLMPAEGAEFMRRVLGLDAGTKRDGG